MSEQFEKGQAPAQKVGRCHLLKQGVRTSLIEGLLSCYGCLHVFNISVPERVANFFSGPFFYFFGIYFSNWRE